MRLPLPVNDEADLGLEPLGALGAVPAAEAGEVLGRLGLLPLRQVPRRREVRLHLVQVPGLAPRLRQRALIAYAHLFFLSFLFLRRADRLDWVGWMGS